MRDQRRKRPIVLRRRYGKYILKYCPSHHFARKDGYIVEHRLIWEQYNNACLLPWVSVFHINGKGDDNRIENLRIKIWTRPVKGSRIARDIAKILKNMGL